MTKGIEKSYVQLKVETKRNNYETQQVQRKKTSFNSIIVHTDHHSHSPMAPSLIGSDTLSKQQTLVLLLSIHFLYVLTVEVTQKVIADTLPQQNNLTQEL